MFTPPGEKQAYFDKMYRLILNTPLVQEMFVASFGFLGCSYITNIFLKLLWMLGKWSSKILTEHSWEHLRPDWKLVMKRPQEINALIPKDIRTSYLGSGSHFMTFMLPSCLYNFSSFTNPLFNSATRTLVSFTGGMAGMATNVHPTCWRPKLPNEKDKTMCKLSRRRLRK